MANFETILDDIKDLDNYFYFMKYAYKYKNDKETDITKKLKEKFPYVAKEETFNDIKLISGILDESEMKSHISSLVPGSFAIYQEFKLISPYFSRDDDELYIIDNPILKEKVFKVPMIRGSGWKGLLLKTAFKILEDKLENGYIYIEEIINAYRKIYRIFGTGSEDFRSLKDFLDDYIDKNIKEEYKLDQLKKELIKYALF